MPDGGEGVGVEVKVPRRRLRHRIWHRVAFLGVTHEKQHVGLTTQAFHTEELEFWRCWHKSGRDAALAYAAADRAAVGGAPGCIEFILHPTGIAKLQFTNLLCSQDTTDAVELSIVTRIMPTLGVS